MENILPSASLRPLSPAKQAMYFPHIPPKIINKMPPSQIVKKVLSPVKKQAMESQAENKKSSPVKSLLAVKALGDNYYNPISKYKRFEIL